MNNFVQEGQRKMLVEKWNSNITLVESVKSESMTPEAKGTLAQLLENTEVAMQMMEATNPAGVAGIKQFAIDLVSVVVPNLVSESLVSVQPMSNQVN